MHSSDETGDERKGLASTGGAAEAETAKLPTHAFRERIRRASVAAAQASTPPGAGAGGSNTAASSGQHTPPSLLAPEQSGVHDRSSDAPPEAASAKTGTGEPAAVSVQKSSSPSWPFAGGRDDRRPQHHTQLGIGMSQRSAAAGPARPASDAPQASSSTEDSDARRRMDTRDTKRSGAPLATRPIDPRDQGRPARSRSNPPPPPTKSTPPRPFRAREAKWSPTSTKPQRASLLRADVPAAAAKGEERAFTKTLREGPRAKAGAQKPETAQPPQVPNELPNTREQSSSEIDSYTLSALADEYLEVSVDAHGLSISATDPLDEQHSQDAEIVEPGASEAPEAASGEEPDSARPRRYTPKQRGRSRDRSGSAEERAEYAPTIPDLRPSFSTVRGQGPQVQNLPTGLPTAGAPVRINQLNPMDPASRMTRPGGVQPVTPDTPTQPRGRPVPRLPLVASPPMFTTKPAFAHPAAFQNARQAPAPGAARPTPRSPFAPALTHRGAAQHPQHEASIVVDPSMNAHVTESRAPQRTDVRPVQQPYQPLPSDPAAFEQMMRDQAAARGARLNWKQQATLVIPREELDAAPEQRLFTPKMLLGFVGATVVGALVMLGISHYGDAGLRRVATDTSTSAASSNNVVIATEPSGAELLLDGAVVGNTPLELPRPPRGQAEMTYVVRMRGFAQELIRLGPESQPAIRVTLTPDPAAP